MKSLLFTGVVSKSRFFAKVRDLLRSESGATAIEYGLIAALIAVVIIGAVTVLGTNLSAKFNAVANNLS
jgi:pilus assembly protein Flp/PilA